MNSAEHLPQLAAFLRKTLEKIYSETASAILTVDRENIEALSTRNHDLNDVPTIVCGKMPRKVLGQIKDLTGINPAILRLLT